jgi:hypothetical protein
VGKTRWWGESGKGLTFFNVMVPPPLFRWRLIPPALLSVDSATVNWTVAFGAVASSSAAAAAVDGGRRGE